MKTILEIKKEFADKQSKKKSYLSKFDLVLLDDRLSLNGTASALGGHQIVLKKRHFPFPVKIAN